MPRQKSVVELSDSTKLPLICWSLLLIISSLSTQCYAQNVVDVTLVETNSGQVRINNNIQFTCSFRFRQGTGAIQAVNLEYGDQNTVCLSWTAPTGGNQATVGKQDLCALPRIATVQQVSTTQFRFTLDDAQLSDEKRFFCKVYESFASQNQSGDINLKVLVPPEDPVLSLSKQPSVVGESLTITCKVNTGKPEGNVVWYTTPSGPGQQEEEINGDTSVRNPFQNGTVELTETVAIAPLEVAHNGAKYRCAARNSAVFQNEAMPSSRTLTLDVQYGVTAVTVQASEVAGQTPQNIPFLYPDTNTKITCAGNGNPSPTIVWTKISGDAELRWQQETLFVDPEAKLGEYVYRCTASNTVDGGTKEVTEDYKFIVQAKPTEPPTTPTPEPTKPGDGPNTGGSTAQISTAGLAGGLAGAVIAILIIVAIVFCVCRRKKKGMLDEDAEQGKASKGQGFDNGPVGGFDVELDDNNPYNSYPKTNGGAFPIDTVDNTPGSRRGFHVPAEPSYDPAYM